MSESTRLPSLLNPEERQGLLLPCSPTLPADVVERMEDPAPVRSAPPESTAALVFSRRPEDYRRAVSLLSEGIPVERIARALKLGVGTVYAIRRRELPEVEAQKEQLATRAREVAASAIEAAAEALADPERRRKQSAKDAALTAAILIDKDRDLRGEASVRVEVDIREPDHDDLMREAAAIGFGSEIGRQMARRAGGQAPGPGEPAAIEAEAEEVAS